VAVDADCDDADPLRSDESDCEGSGQADDTASTDVLGDGELSGKGCAITPTPAGLLLALGGLLTLTRRQRRS
jgi:MYXO-CTERM domain-containing protein